MKQRMINDTYAITQMEIAPEVCEVSVKHITWLDIQLTQGETPALVLAPTGVYMTTTVGLVSVRKAKDLWDTIPKVYEEGIDTVPRFADNADATAVFNYLMNRIKDALPNFQFIEERERRERKRR